MTSPEREVERLKEEHGTDSTAAAILAEETGFDPESFEYEGEVPSFEGQETEAVSGDD